MFRLSTTLCMFGLFNLLYSLGVSAQTIEASAQIEKITLGNDKITAEITPDIGGRLLSFSLKDRPSFLLLADLSSVNLNPLVNAYAENIGYLGHEIWIGPQSEWWSHQKVNLKRATEKAIWPPDPYLILAKNTVIKQSAQKVVIETPKSPVSGVQITKTYELIPDRSNSIKLHVDATNIRTENIAWDIWFNTRVFSNTHVYIPVANNIDIRQKNLEDEKNAPLVYTQAAGIFSLDMLAPPAGKVARKGKLMIQPSQGWMAAFHDKQLFVVQFALQPQSVIHPDQGQIELYNEYTPSNLHTGLLEMEVHAPYKKLAPKEHMTASEMWTIMDYSGDDSRAEQLLFLHHNAKKLGLKF